MIRTLVVFAGVLMVGIGGVYFSKVETYEAPESPVVTEKVITEDMLAERIKTAQTQEMGRLEQKSQQAYDEKMEQGLKEIKLEVIRAYQAELDELETTLEKEVGTYWKSKSNVKALIRDYFPEDAERAIAVANCESGLNQEAIGPTQDYGLFQIHLPSHQRKAEQLGLDVVNNIEDNITFARMLYDEEQWRPWVCAWHPQLLAFKW